MNTSPCRFVHRLLLFCLCYRRFPIRWSLCSLWLYDQHSRDADGTIRVPIPRSPAVLNAFHAQVVVAIDASLFICIWFVYNGGMAQEQSRVTTERRFPCASTTCQAPSAALRRVGARFIPWFQDPNGYSVLACIRPHAPATGIARYDHGPAAGDQGNKSRVRWARKRTHYSIHWRICGSRCCPWWSTCSKETPRRKHTVDPAELRPCNAVSHAPRHMIAAMTRALVHDPFPSIGKRRELPRAYPVRCTMLLLLLLLLLLLDAVACGCVDGHKHGRCIIRVESSIAGAQCSECSVCVPLSNSFKR